MPGYGKDVGFLLTLMSSNLSVQKEFSNAIYSFCPGVELIKAHLY